MKNILPLLFLLLLSINLSAEETPLSHAEFVVSDRGPGSGELNGTIDETSRSPILDIDYQNLSGPLVSAHIHMGTIDNPGDVLLQLQPFSAELADSGKINN